MIWATGLGLKSFPPTPPIAFSISVLDLVVYNYEHLLKNKIIFNQNKDYDNLYSQNNKYYGKKKIVQK